MKKEDIIYKALKDPKFKEKLINDPKKILEKEFKQKFNEKVNVKIIEEKPNEITLVIPKLPDNHQISDKELKQISGNDDIKTYKCNTHFCPMG